MTKNMIMIAHRGNTVSRKLELENQPGYILEAIKQGFHVEIDVFYIDHQYWLGHDAPQYLITKDFLQQEELWCHAKTSQALAQMLEDNIHCFFHQTDDYTLTSRGFIWCFPQKQLSAPDRSIALLPEHSPAEYQLKDKCIGICSDYIANFKEDLNFRLNK